jgi:hypothetical protein
MPHTDKQDLIVYGALGLSFGALLLFKGGNLIEGINNQSIVSQNARIAAKDNQIAESRFGLGCNTGIVMNDGSPNLIEGSIPLDIQSRTPIAKGALLCDQTGATAIVAPDGTVSDIRVSARVRKTYLQRGFREENARLQQ